MYKEIGSDFWINKNINFESKKLNLDFLNINKKEYFFLSSGRKAIEFVLKNLMISNEKKVALLPSFSCYSVIEPFIKDGYRINYYNLNRTLFYDKEDFISDILRYNPKVVLFHSYFGFDTLKYIKEDIIKFRDNGIIFIEDLTQSMYSDFEHTQSNYYISSFRKWSAIPDGGLVVSSLEKFKIKPPIKNDFLLEKSKIEAFHKKYLYMEKSIGNKNDILNELFEAEKNISNQKEIFLMSKISKKIQSNLCIGILKQKRKENFLTLLLGLKNSCYIKMVFNYIFEYITPLYFPVYVNNYRNDFQEYLSENKIYAPIVWPKPNYCYNRISEEVDWIYNHILCLPCDQRYDYDDMKRIVDVINSYEKKI